MKDFFLWKNANIWAYSASIASTWIWSPAIFVASSKAYYDGIWGFLMFLIPNILTLVLFAYFAEMVRKNKEGFTLVQAMSIGKSSGVRYQPVISSPAALYTLPFLVKSERKLNAATP